MNRIATTATTIEHEHEIVIRPTTQTPGVLDTRPIAAGKSMQATAGSLLAACRVPRPLHHSNRVGGDQPVTRRMLIARSPKSVEADSPESRYFLSAVEALRLVVPPKYPVVVQVNRKLIRNEGDCLLAGRKFRIRVSRDLNLSHAIHVLLHEWAHALSWHACVGGVARSRRISAYEFDLLSHGPEWGLAYSKVYQSFIYQIQPQLKTPAIRAALLESRKARRKEATK